MRLLIATGYRTPRKLLDRIFAYAGTPLYREYADKGYLTTEWPVGEWAFVDPAADLLFPETVRYLDRSDGVDFEDVETFFLAGVSEWEAARAGGDGRRGAAA